MISPIVGIQTETNFRDQNKAFRRVETLFVQGRNLYLAGLLLVVQGLFTFRQPIADLQGTSFYLGRINFLHVKRPYNTLHIEFFFVQALA